MTLADYDAIRQHLDHPPVVVFDPCAPVLAPEDPDWPLPGDGHQLETDDYVEESP